MAFSSKPPILTSPLVQASGSGSGPGTSAFAAAPVRPKTYTTAENAARSRTPEDPSQNPRERVSSPQRQLSHTQSLDSTETSYSGRETDDSNRLCHVANRSKSSSSSDNVCEVANPDSVSDTVSSDVVESESSSESGPSCSGRGATRFMDKNTFVFRQVSLNPVPKIISKFVRKYGTVPPTDDVQSIMQKLHKARNEDDRQHTLQIIQAGLLPKLRSDHNLKELAQCLKVNDLDVQIMATTYLQAQLLHLDDRDNPALTEELLMVAKTTQETFCQGSDTDSHVHVLGYIHLLSVCALVSRNPKPSAEQCKTLVFSSAPDKKKDSVLSGKTLMARAFNVFYKHFHHNAVQGKGWPIPVWKNISWKESDRVHLKQSFEKMNECQQLVVVYSLLSELERTIQGELTNRLVATLSDLKDVLHKVKKKDKDKEAFWFAFDLMVVRGLVFLLNSAFREVMIQVGHSPGKEDHLRGIIDLLLSIIRGGDRRLKDETHVLPFHKVFQVRSAFSLLLFEDNQPQCLLAISYIKKYLQIFGFRMNTNVSVLGRTAMKQCQWYELDCFFVQNEAHLIALVPKHTCLATGPILDECVSDHVKRTSSMKSKDRQILKMARCRQQNIKMLVLLNSVDSPCEHILRLYAYQFSPFPFCITEPIQERRLLQFLLSHRQQHKWLDRYTQQHILKDITDGLIFLKQNDIVLRDITTYNMLVEGRPEQGMSLTDILPSGKFTVKLAEFGLAHQVTNPVYQHDTSMKVAAEDQGPVPCRWIPHEALGQGEYSEKSEVYALGCVTFEVSTHGCQPFTSYDRTISTEQLLLKILFDPESVSLHHWRCIPDDTFHFIRKCMHTKPEERPTLQNIATDLKNPEEDRTHIADSVHMGLDLACDWHKLYPPISPDQLLRRHEPEKGIPAAVQRCIDDGGEMMVTYVNTQVESRRSVKKSAMKKEELLADDWMQIIPLGEDSGTRVKEYVSETFVSEVFATLEGIHLDGVDCWDNIYKSADTQQNDTTGLRLHERVYSYSIDLLSAAKSPELWDTVNLHDPYVHDENESENDIVHAKYIHVFISLTQRLMALHEHRLCHCDVRACNVLIDCKTGEVILPRLGRMRLLPDNQDHVSTVIYEDSLRWYPPEVTLGLDYDPAMCCTASDVYMLGMTFWETFNIREVVCADPAATEVNFVPFSNTPRDEVAGMSRQANSLSQPANCPEWMFELIKRCRHPDHASRPSCSEVLQELNRHCTSAERPDPPFWSGRLMLAADNDDTESEPPALPKRRGGILGGVVKLFRRASKKPVFNRLPYGDRMSRAFSTLSVYEAFPDIDETLPKAFLRRDRDPNNWILRSPDTQKSRLSAWSASDGGYLHVTDLDSNIDYYSDGKWMPRPDYDQHSTAAESVQHRSRSHQKQDDQDDQSYISIPRPDYFEYSPQSRHAQGSECDTYQRPVSSADSEQNGGQQQPSRGRRLPLPKEWK